ncbi:hypothetical protein MRX96_001324 [Rhipicephalus microplus]
MENRWRIARLDADAFKAVSSTSSSSPVTTRASPATPEGRLQGRCPTPRRFGRNQADPSHASNSDLLYDSSFPAGSPRPRPVAATSDQQYLHTQHPCGGSGAGLCRAHFHLSRR